MSFPDSLSSLPTHRSSSDHRRPYKIGLRSLLVILMVVCSVLYMAGAVKSQLHLIQFYSDVIPSASFDETSNAPPTIMTPRNTGRNNNRDSSRTTTKVMTTEHETTDDTEQEEEDADAGNVDEDNVEAASEEEENGGGPGHSITPDQSIHNRTVVPFEKQDGVIIVTKIHGPHQLALLEQSLCLLHYAYNRRPQYDVLVFTTLPVSDVEAQPLRDIVQPVKLSFVVDNRGIQTEIAALSPERRENFLKACQVSNPDNLTWWSNCPNRIAYNWQAEFRAWHIWKNSALKDYKWMMWLDADGFCTEEWKIDPIQPMIENDLVILFDNWPKGVHKGKDVQERIRDAFGVQICNLRIKKGHIVSTLSNDTETGRCQGRGRVADIHGFFHITNLDFYRTDAVQKWAETWIGDGFLQRRYDDQAGVTIPAAILAPERAWDMRRNKIQLNVFHNFDMDGKKFERVGGFLKFWRKVVKQRFPTAADVCRITNGA